MTRTSRGAPRAPGAVARLTALAVCALVCASPAAGQSTPRDSRPATIDYRGTGVVLALLPPPSSLHATQPVIVIEHEPIAGLMDERMSMPFIAASTNLFDGLKVGDRITFGLTTTLDALLVVTIHRLR